MTYRVGEGFHRALFEHSLDGILLTAPDGQILEANPAACRMLGRSVEEIRLAGRSGVLDTSDPRLAAALSERAAKGHTTAELVFVRGDGSRFPAEVTTAVFTDRQGNPRTSMIIRDISLRIALENEREQYFRFFRLSGDPLCIADPFGCFRRVNPAMVKLTGYSEAELLSRPLLDFVVPEDRPRTLEELQQHVSARPTRHFVNRYRCKDGRTVRLSWTAYFDKREGLTYATARDITQQTEAEQALRKNYELLDRIFATTHFSIVYLDRNFNFLRVSKAYADACGHPPEFFPGRNHFDLYPHPENEAIFRRVLTSGQPFTIYAKPFEFKDDPERGVTYWDWSLHPLMDEKGDIDGLLFALLDVTQRKRAEQEQAQLAAIVESSNDAILIRGLDRTIQSWNLAAERLFGWSALEAVGQLVDLIVPPERTGTLRRFIEGAARDEAPGPVETTHLRKDGARIPTQVTFSPVKDAAGRVIAHSYTVRDMSELKDKEEALRASSRRLRQLSHRLRSVEEAERRAIARELHDRIGQDLSTLGLLLASLGARLAPASRDAVERPLNDIQGLLKTMVANVRDVMAELRPPVLDDYGLLAALSQLASEFAQRTGITVDMDGVELQPRLPSVVETAMFRISQEALSNVAKHARAKLVAISLHAATDRIVLEIADDGIGFDASRTPPDQRHWGLGTMRERAEEAGVTFVLESTPGAGSRVVLEVERAAT